MRKLKLMKTLLVAAGLAVGASDAWADSLIFSEDFADETYNVTWGAPSSGGVEPKVTDGKLTVANGSQSGDRSAYIAFGENAHTGCCRLTFDMAMTKSGWDGKNNLFYVLPSATTARYPGTTDAALSITQDYNGAITIAGESVGTYNGTSLTYDLFLNTTTGKATVIVKNGSTTIKTITYATTATGINTLNLQFNKNNGAFAIDNISFYSLTAPAFTLAEDTKSVSVDGTETVNVNDITGTISVSSNNTAAATASYADGKITINGVATGVATITVTGENDGLTLEKTIEVTVGTVATTTVTVNYLCGGSAIASPLVLSDVAVGSILTAAEVTYSNVLYGSNCRYVNPVLSESLPYTVVEDGVINITYTQQAAVTSLNVQAIVNSTKHLIKTYELTDKYIGDVITIYYPRFYLSGTTLYSTTQSAHNNYYDWNYTLDGNDAEVEYDTQAATNVVYYKEAEDIEGMTSDNSGNVTVRCSGGAGGRSDDEVTLATLGTGAYTLTARVWGNAGSTFTYSAAGSTIMNQSTVGYLLDASTAFTVVSGTADIKVEGTNANGKVIDYVYIQKVGDVNGLLFNGDFSNSTWNAGWCGTGTDKKAAFNNNTNDLFTGNFAEMWAGGSTTFSAEGNLYQTLVNVPVGSYSLSAKIVNTATQGTGVLYAKVGGNDDVTTDANSLSSVTEKKVSFTVSSMSNVVIGFKTTGITGGTGWLALDDFAIEQTGISVTVTDAGYATYVNSDYDLNFTDSEIKAYKVKVSTKGEATLTKVDNVPAGTPVLLYKDGGATEDIPVMTGAAAVSDNDLVAGTGAAVATTEGDYTNMILNNVAGNIGFYFANDQTVAKNRAYLHIATSLAPNAEARMAMVFAEETQGISAVGASESKAEGYYNLSGQRVAQPTKGLYIVNGKKVIIK